MEGDPGSMSAYARAVRDMFKGEAGPGPAAYGVKWNSIFARNEMIAPFDTTEVRLKSRELDGPGPIYFPFKRDRWQRGSPIFGCCCPICDRFHEKIDFSADPCYSAGCMDAGPVWRRIPDPWVIMTDKILAMACKRPRVSYEKYVSNCIPTIYHPLNIRCFIKGIDGREYPWRLDRTRLAGPADYNTYQIYTSFSKIPPKINFGSMSERKSIFVPTMGAGPAGYFVRRPGRSDTGKFLGERFDDPGSSAWRLFDLIQRQTRRDNFMGPVSSVLPCFPRCSPKACLAPFKSKTPLGFAKPLQGPGPADHFIVEMEESDLSPKLKPGLITCPPDKAPFDTSQVRFMDFELFEMMDRPAPTDYDILGFTDLMLRDLARHPPVFVNPKLGFLSSAEARPPHKGKGDINIVTEDPEGCNCLCDRPRKWRNLRPRSGKTYGYNGKPPKCPDSPGPIYDTAPGAAAVKSRKSWFDPRNPSRTGFFNSGCTRKTDFFHLDRSIPGPGKYFSKLPCCNRLRTTCPPCHGPRFLEIKSDSPGPVHKLHEKCDSIWRATHLGTFNAELKHVGLLFPWAGGFIKQNMNLAGDAVWGITREDEYGPSICPKTIDQAKQGHVYRSPKSLPSRGWSTNEEF